MMPEQVALLDKAEKSLHSARLIANEGEGYYPFAVSRAYYAMFYIAEAFLIGKGLSFSKHKGVIAAFGEQFCKVGLCPLDFHRFLIDAHKLRNTGDYDALAAISQEDANRQIERAQAFIDCATKSLRGTR